jgi:hypothetical protein
MIEIVALSAEWSKLRRATPNDQNFSARELSGSCARPQAMDFP